MEESRIQNRSEATVRKRAEPRIDEQFVLLRTVASLLFRIFCAHSSHGTFSLGHYRFVASIGQFPKKSAIIRAFYLTCGGLYQSRRSAPVAFECVSLPPAGEKSRHYFEESERTFFKVELSLISIISLLVVCSAVLLSKQASKNGRLSFLISKFRPAIVAFGAAVTTLAAALPTYAQHQGGEASLELPDLNSVTFFNGLTGHNLLMVGIVISFLGLGFGLAIYMNLKKLPVHRAMKEISELIYETCKTYLITQGKFILILEAFIAVIIILYFGVLSGLAAGRVVIILALAWSVLPVVTALPGSVSALTLSPTRGPHSQVLRVNPFPFTLFRLKPA